MIHDKGYCMSCSKRVFLVIIILCFLFLPIIYYLVKPYETPIEDIRSHLKEYTNPNFVLYSDEDSKRAQELLSQIKELKRVTFPIPWRGELSCDSQKKVCTLSIYWLEQDFNSRGVKLKAKSQDGSVLEYDLKFPVYYYNNEGKKVFREQWARELRFYLTVDADEIRSLIIDKDRIFRIDPEKLSGKDLSFAIYMKDGALSNEMPIEVSQVSDL